MNPTQSAAPISLAMRLPPSAGFLLWWVRCDEWLAAAFLPPLAHDEAATLFRAGLSVDEVVARAQDMRS